MRPELFLGIDQGSSSTKGLLLDQAGTPLASWTEPAPEIKRDGVCVEQDPEGILDSVKAILQKALAAAKSDGRQIRAWGLATQRSGVLAWRANGGEVQSPMITWADTRTQPMIDDLALGTERISGLTGLPTLANFAAPKIHLLRKQFLDQNIRVATLDSFLVERLSNGKLFVTDDTMAARTMLYSLDDRGWNEWLCGRFGVELRSLPKIVPSLSEHFVYENIPLMALLGDQHAALFGRFNLSPRPLLNLGTIASLSIATGSRIVRQPSLKTGVFYSRYLSGIGSRELNFMIESTSSVTGTVLLEPLRRGWVSDTEELDNLCQQAYETNPNGLATAYWTNREPVKPAFPDGVPNVTVCRPGAQLADRVRAVVENVGNLIVRMIEECHEKGLFGESFPIEIDLSGGGSASEYLTRYIADVSGHTLRKIVEARDVGAFGAACAAWSATYPQHDIKNFVAEERVTLYPCQNPERRRRYLAWLRMEQDALKGALPPHAEIDEK
jgi:glycerol kinase